MATFGVTMVKDEADVIAGTLRHMCDEVDHVIVADNGSTDGTTEILANLVYSLPISLVDDAEPAYRQSEKMSRLAALAGERGATWIVPFDADELWYSRHGRIADVLAGLPFDLVRAPLYNHLRTALDVDDPDPFRSMVWRQKEPGALPKVAFRWQDGAVIHQGNHGVTLPGFAMPTFEPVLELRHFPVRSPEHMARKARNGAAAYAAAPELPADWGAHWRAWGALLDAHGEEAIADAFRAHWWYLSPVDAGLVHDPAPYLRWRTDAAQG